MSAIFRVTRRDFLRAAGLGTGALVFGCRMSSAGTLLDKVKSIKFELNPFVAIQIDGTFVIMAHRSEMGQGIRSSLAAVLADELEVDWDRVIVRQAEADGPRFAIANPNPGGRPEFLITDEGSQFADSSRSMAAYFDPMRLFGAGIRLVFLRAAALKFGGDETDYVAENHRVKHKSNGQSVDYLHLLLHAKKAKVPTVPEIRAALKKSQDWTFIGETKKKMPFVDAQDMVTGRAVYGADVDLDRFGRPDMLTAMIVHCPVANGEVGSFDDTAARQVPGVVDVVVVRLPAPLPAGGVGAGFAPHAGVAVLAKNTWAAWQGRRALKVEWDLTGNPNADYESQAYRRELEASTAQPGKLLRSRGNVDDAFAVGPKVVEADYYVPHLAQAPMEPPVAVALFEDGRWNVWCPTQGPELAQHYIGLSMLEQLNPVKWLAWQVCDPADLKECEREGQRDFNEELGRVLGVDQATLFKIRDDLKAQIRDKVKVHVTLLGGGFGRKSKPDYAIEAAFLARLHPGVPIRVQWTREDDIQFSYFHGVSHQRLKAAIDGGGRATAWLQRSAFPSFFATLFPPPLPPLPEEVRPVFAKARAAFHNGGEFPYASAIERAHGLEDMPFDVKHLRIENCPALPHIRGGWMRSVSNIFHAFAIGSFADELAIAAGRDSKDYLLELIGDGEVLDLEKDGVLCFDNNGFPVKWEGTPPVLPPYPPDTRRLRTVVEKVAAEAGWDEKVEKYKGMKGRGLGIAAHRSFLSYAAMVVDVSLSDAGVLTIHEIHGAVDCGIAVNPDRVRAQIEGGIVYALSLALHGEITVKNGAVEQHNFDDYPVLRLYQTPKIVPHIVKYDIDQLLKDDPDDPRARPTGIGEIPVPPVAPALANAIVAAGGPRIRALPVWRSVTVL